MDLNGYFDFRCAEFGEFVLECSEVIFDMLKLLFSQPLLLQRALTDLDRPRHPDDVLLVLQIIIGSTGSLGS